MSSSVRMPLPVAVVPGVCDRLGHVLLEVRIAERRDRRHVCKVAVEDRAAGELEGRPLLIERQVGHRQVIHDAGTDLQPVGVHGGDRAHVHEIDLFDEALHLVQKRLHLVQLRHVQRGVVVQVDRIGDAADGEVLDVRRLAAEDGDDLVRLALVVECLQVVRHGQQVHFGRELHRRVPPIAVREDAKLALGDKARQPVLHGLELRRAVPGPVRQAGGERSGLGRIALEGREHVDPVERRQLVEVHDMVVQRVRGDDQIADVLRVARNLELQRVLDCPHRGDRVHRGTDAAEALGEQPRVTGVAPLEDALDPSKHLPRRPGLRHPAAVDLDVDAQVAFNARHRIDRDMRAHQKACLLATVWPDRIGNVFTMTT